MIGKRILRERFQPQTCSGKKAHKTGQVKGKFENIVIIDIDSDQVDDVVIIDPAFVQQKSRGSSVPSRDRIFTRQSVISIDVDDESDDADHPGIIAEGVGEVDSDASSSKRFSPGPSCKQNSVCIDDDCHDYQKDFVCKQKGRQTCNAKATYGNGYGLDVSENESSEGDFSDCELMEVREQWEKASSKRKGHVFNDQSCYNEHASSSGFHSNIYIDIEEENRSQQHAGSTVYSGPSDGKYVKENHSSFSFKGDRQVDGTFFNLRTTNPCKDSDQKVDQESFKCFRSESIEEMQSLYRSSDIEHGERIRSEDVSSCTNYENHNICSGVTSASRLKNELGGEESKFMSLSQEECERQGGNNVSALRGKAYNLSEVNSNCASFEERHVNRNGLVLRAQDGGVNASNERDIINEREKLKETDEYKRAIEEEWASRQRQLQIQAEEAQRLRKRKRAESQRLLDMQRRQKERIEEVRETQKKDEEFMNMKEQLRVEVRKGLNNLEMQCSDMASLLRGLGVHVGGGFIPLPNEVHAAYKRALFKFHPDRASKTDIREQVEAEEKFKLISRMKEKLLLTSCH